MCGKPAASTVFRTPISTCELFPLNTQVEPGAIVSRVAENFIRFGSYQLPASRNDHKLLKQIADHTIKRSFPQYLDASDEFDDDENRYVLLLRDVIERTAKMVSHWHTVGFVHGVCNTDNFSVLGLTIDYGPYGFLDEYNPAYTPNTSDLPGRRYCYGRQPTIGLWNLVKFAEALVPLIGLAAAQAAVERYKDIFTEELQGKVQRKLGLMSWVSEDDEMHSALLENMQKVGGSFPRRGLGALESLGLTPTRMLPLCFPVRSGTKGRSGFH